MLRPGVAAVGFVAASERLGALLANPLFGVGQLGQLGAGDVEGGEDEPIADVARAELAKLADDEEGMGEQCAKAIAICDEPDCGYAWAKQDAQALLDQ